MTRSALTKKIFCVTVISWFALMLYSTCAYAQGRDAVVGKWKMVSIGGDGDEIQWTLTITNDNGKYSAVSDTEGGQSPVKELSIADGKIHFRVPYQGEEYAIDLKLDGDTLVGTWSGGDASGETKGHRAASS